MKFYNRRSIRLPEYDYGQKGGYFITICTQGRKCILSRVIDNGENEKASLEYSHFGRIVERVLLGETQKFGATLDSYVIMPNHIHAIIIFASDMEQRKTIGRLIGAVKSIAANEWIRKCDSDGVISGKLWQRNYYEHILRNDQDYLEKRKYIEKNPDQWCMDEEYAEY